MNPSTSTPNHMNQHHPPYPRPRSSSISSIITTNGIPAPNFDVHTLYRIKTTKSSKKLDHFFGEQAPHDICIAEIKKEGLKALLQSKVPLCYFLHHLLEEYSHENLFFFIELEQYETFQYVSQIQQLATAQHIFNTYLTRNSHFEVNLDDKVRRTVTEALQNKDVGQCFETAKRSVYSLLESSYMRFLMTDTYQLMVNNCGNKLTIIK
ncbi:RGS domain-containing protein [Cunninghamella echinulata]|nr:RGS domain-containing protein [Cunninghamella echinulata]